MALKFPAFFFMLPLIYLMASMVSTSAAQGPYPITLVVYNSLSKQKNMTLTTEIAYRGILLGAMRKLAKENSKFRFTIKEDPNYGPFLVSVNGLAGNNEQHTYWELLAQTQNGTIIRPDVGVGCYIPNPQNRVILKYTKW